MLGSPVSKELLFHDVQPSFQKERAINWVSINKLNPPTANLISPRMEGQKLSQQLLKQNLASMSTEAYYRQTAAAQRGCRFHLWAGKYNSYEKQGGPPGLNLWRGKEGNESWGVACTGSVPAIPVFSEEVYLYKGEYSNDQQAYSHRTQYGCPHTCTDNSNVIITRGAETDHSVSLL